MSSTEDKDAELRQKEYEIRNQVNRLRREVFQQEDPSASSELLNELSEVEGELKNIENQVIKAVEDDQFSGLVVDSRAGTRTRGRRSTGLEAKVFLRMAQIPTSYYHLLDSQQDPLISCRVDVKQVGQPSRIRRVRVTSFIEEFSARAINTFEVENNHSHSFNQLPTLFRDRVQKLDESTRATLNILVEDLDGAIELHETYPIWLLARTTAPLAVRDPKTGKWREMMPYFGAFVTPNARSLMKFLRTAADKHPRGRLVGYQGSKDEVTAQVKALFQALKEEANITYVNSLIDHSPEQGFAGQRVRLPRESLEERQANCIDGTVLFASLLEGISINPALVLIPGHAFLAWETWQNSGEWKYLETTMIGTSNFEQACNSAETTAAHYESKGQLKQYPVNKLRTDGILPME